MDLVTQKNITRNATLTPLRTVSVDDVDGTGVVHLATRLVVERGLVQDEADHTGCFSGGVYEPVGGATAAGEDCQHLQQRG
jgi:hypothetical protein